MNKTKKNIKKYKTNKKTRKRGGGLLGVAPLKKEQKGSGLLGVAPLKKEQNK